MAKKAVRSHHRECCAPPTPRQQMWDTGEMPGVRQDSTGHRGARNASEPRPRPRTSARLKSVASPGEIVSSACTYRPRKNTPASAERRKRAAWVPAHKKHCGSPTHDYARPGGPIAGRWMDPEHLHRGRRAHDPGVAYRCLPPPDFRPVLILLPPLSFLYFLLYSFVYGGPGSTTGTRNRASRTGRWRPGETQGGGVRPPSAAPARAEMQWVRSFSLSRCVTCCPAEREGASKRTRPGQTWGMYDIRGSRQTVD